jgi:hypothetical protein
MQRIPFRQASIAGALWLVASQPAWAIAPGEAHPARPCHGPAAEDAHLARDVTGKRLDGLRLMRGGHERKTSNRLLGAFR